MCIPNYNYAHYIGKTIESVLAQTYDNFEIVIADNASTDESLDVIRAFGSDKIRIYENKYNVGFAPNIDKATAPARNDYVIVISSDDVMNPDALQTYARVIEGLGDQAERAVLTSAIDVIDADGAITDVMYRPPGDLFYQSIPVAQAEDLTWAGQPVDRHPGSEALQRTLRAKDSPAVFLATCYSRKLYEQVEGYNSGYRMWPDGHFLNKVLSLPDTELVYVPERLFQYRVHSRNQLAGEAKQGALKYQVDAYLHTVEFPDDVLDRIGMRRGELVDVFIEKAVMERGLQAMAASNAERALKCLAFGFATYPRQAAFQPKTYALAGLIAMGPVGTKVAAGLYRWHRRRRDAS